jgi:hypothetical protein
MKTNYCVGTKNMYNFYSETASNVATRRYDDDKLYSGGGNSTGGELWWKNQEF